MFWIFSQQAREKRAQRKWQNSRLIYEFFDGENYRKVDPSVVSRKLEKHPTYRPDVHLPLAEKGEEEAIQIILDAVRESFGLPVFDSLSGSGLTEVELIDLLTDFSYWVDDIKKKLPNSPTQLQPSESTSGSSGETITQPGLGSP